MSDNDQTLEMTPVDDGKGTIPYDRFQQVVKARQAAETELATLRKAEADRLAKEAEARGEYTKVIEDLRPKAKRADELEGVISELLASQLAALTDDARETVAGVLIAIPTPEAKLMALQLLAPKLTVVKPTPAPLDGGKGSGAKIGGLTAAQLQMAEWAGVSPEEYAKNL
jgi:hypothetical protein